MGLLVGAGSAALLGLVCAVVGGGKGVWLVGWLLASVVVVSLVSAFVLVDGKRREDANYSPRPELRRVRLIIVAVGVIVAAANAFEFATEVARRS